MRFDACFGPREAVRLDQHGLFVLLGALLVGSLACGSKAHESAQGGDGDQTQGGDDSDETDPADDSSEPDADESSRVDAGKPQGTGKADAGSKPGPGGAADAGGPSSSKSDAGTPPGADNGSDQDDAATPSDAGSPPPSGPSDTTIATIIPAPSNGAGEIRPSTTVLKSGKGGGKDVWDFENKKIGVNNTVDCEGSEGQLTVFEVEDGVTVKNLIIAGGKPGGNGIVCKGSCTLDHVYWEDVCEDAATNSKDGATMTLDHVIALHASDKVFQHNAKAGAKTVIKNSFVSDFGKLWRSCGDCTANGGPRHLVIDNVRVEGIKTAVAGANQNYGDTVTVKNLYVNGGYDAAKDKPKICQEYIGVTDHNGESTKVNDGASQWNTATCKLSRSDVKS